MATLFSQTLWHSLLHIMEDLPQILRVCSSIALIASVIRSLSSAIVFRGLRNIWCLIRPRRKQSGGVKSRLLGSARWSTPLVLQKNPSCMSELLMSTKPNESSCMSSHQWSMFMITQCVLFWNVSILFFMVYEPHKPRVSILNEHSVQE